MLLVHSQLTMGFDQQHLQKEREILIGWGKEIVWTRDGFFLSWCHQSPLEGEEPDLIKVSSGQHMQSMICIASIHLWHEVDLGEKLFKSHQEERGF